jgi:hypothetical protein
MIVDSDDMRDFFEQSGIGKVSGKGGDKGGDKGGHYQHHHEGQCDSTRVWRAESFQDRHIRQFRLYPGPAP